MRILSKSSRLLSLRPCLARLGAFSFFFYWRFFIETSRLDFSEQTFILNFALQNFNSFFYIISDYSYLYDNLSPVSSITWSPSLSKTAPASAETSSFPWLLGSCLINDQITFHKFCAVQLVYSFFCILCGWHFNKAKTLRTPRVCISNYFYWFNLSNTFEKISERFLCCIERDTSYIQFLTHNLTPLNRINFPNSLKLWGFSNFKGRMQYNTLKSEKNK